MIWASSFIFVKMGLEYMGPLTIAGLRYFLAALMLLPFIIRRRNVARSWSARLWLRLFLIGLSAYTIGNGAMFWGLKYLPATTAAFMLSFSPLLTLFVGAMWLKEIPTRWQMVGVAIALIGSGLFFSPGLSLGEPLGLSIVAVGLVGFVSFGVLGREVARDRQVDTLSLTAIPLVFGGGLLMLIALPLEGLPIFSPAGWGIVLWMAVVNTAFGYILYYHSIRVLTALEMSAMLNLAPLATAVFAWYFLRERLENIQIAGMVTVIAGVMFIQWQGQRRNVASAGEQRL